MPEDAVCRWAFWPAVVVVISIFLGGAYGFITSHLISPGDIRTQIVEQCRATPGIGVEQPPLKPEHCASKESLGEIKGRVTWAVAAGVTAISGTASLIYCIFAPVGLVLRRKFPAPDIDFRNAYLALLSIGGGVVLLLVILYLQGARGIVDTLFVNSIYSTFDVLFATINAPSQQASIAWVIEVWVMPTSALVVALTLGAYIAVCAACTARIVQPANITQQKGAIAAQPAGAAVVEDGAALAQQDGADILAARMRLLNRVVLVSSAAMTLAILATGVFSAWPSALVSGMGGADALANALEELGTASTLHWATGVVAFALPAYLVAISILSWRAQAMSTAAVLEANNPDDKDDRYAAELAWMKKRGMEIDWPAIVKSVVAIFTPLLAGTVTSAAAALVH